ncbi:MAG: hypothetical protein AAGA48_05650 [Myxococcota bacterium]
MRRSSSLLFGAAFTLLLGGCIQTVPLGPQLGDCAEPPPDGRTFTYGDIGIGTCLSGPADIEFFEEGGRTWLAVSNADPYRTFITGSVLAIDWDAVVDQIDPDASFPSRILLNDTIATAAVFTDDDELDEDTDGGNPFLGGIGRPAGSSSLLVAGRLTEGSNIRAGRDELFVIDTSGLPDRLEKVDELLLRDDPYPVVFDADADRTYVGNLTDHSISIVERDPDGGPNGFAPVDASTGQGVGRPQVRDPDGSGSLIELAFVEETARREIENEVYTMTYISGTRRLFVPTPGEEQTTLIRYYSGDGVSFITSGFGPEQGVIAVGSTEVDDLLVEGQPFITLDGDGVPLMVLARDLTIDETNPLFAVLAQPATEVGGLWNEPLALIVSSDPLSAPSLVGGIEGQVLVVTVETENGPRIQRSSDAFGNLQFSTLESAFAPDVPDIDRADPYVLFDERVRRYRMWSTEILADGRRRIVHAVSRDALEFDEPVAVIDTDVSVAAPTVNVIDAQYQMWFAMETTTGWDIAHARSADGITFGTPRVIFEDVAAKGAPPPRVAVLSEQVNAYRAEGANFGRFQNFVVGGAGGRTDFGGFVLSVVHGHEVSNDVVVRESGDAPIAKLGLLPGSVAEVGGRTLVYATALDGPTPDSVDGVVPVGCRPGFDQTPRLVVLEQEADGDIAFVGSLTEDLDLRADQMALSPAVIADDQGVVLIYAVQGPTQTFLQRATSTDGVTFTVDTTDVVNAAAEANGFDGNGRLPHAFETTEDGRIRLWYTADNGTTCTIGTLVADSARGTFSADGPQPAFDVGLVGAFDGEGVRDPAPATVDGQPVLVYSGLLDGVWRLGTARFDEATASWVRDEDPLEPLPQPSAPGLTNAFSSFGTDSPAVVPVADGDPELLYAGYDGLARRMGRAELAWMGGRPVIFPVPRQATAGDFVTFETERQGSLAGFPETVIELAQQTARFVTDGEGMAGLTLDPERGFLYVTSKTSSLSASDRITVVDVRDDSSAGFSDANVLDLEGVVEVDLAFGTVGGFRNSLVDPVRNALYLTMTEPDGVAVVNLDDFVDNGEKEVTVVTAEAVLPLPDLVRDAGAESDRTFIGGAGMTLAPDGRTLVVTHFRGNGVAMFDLELGAYGEQIAWIPNIGENPHVVELSPDGRYGVVANYVGEVDGNQSSSTLAVLDLDPTSPSFRDVVAWIANR